MINTLESRLGNMGIEVGSEIEKVKDRASAKFKKYQTVLENAHQKAKDATQKAKDATQKAKTHILGSIPIQDLEKLPNGTLQVMLTVFPSFLINIRSKAGRPEHK